MQATALSVIMPAYNEAPTLAATVRRVLRAADRLDVSYELVIVNDASRDHTGEIAETLCAEHPHTIRVAHNRRNLRMGGAILRGIRLARYAHCLVCEVDSPLTATQMRRFLHASAHADIVVGYRSKRVGYSPWMYAASRLYWWILHGLFGTRLKDLTWVCLYHRSIFSTIRVRYRWIVFFPEVLLKAERAGFRLAEVRCDMRPRTQGIATVSRPRVIVRALWDTARLWCELRRRAA